MTIKISNHEKSHNLHREEINLVLFLIGKFISMFGSAIYSFAVGLYLLRITGSGLTFATNIVLYTLPMVLLNPLAGVIADRVNKKLVVVGSDLTNALLLVAVYIIAGSSGLSVMLLYSSTFLITVLATFFNIALEAAKPQLVGKEKLIDINSMARVIESGSHIAGPLLGGVIYSFFDIRAFILFNALSFFLAALLELFIDFNYNKNRRFREEKIEREKMAKVGQQIKEGLLYITNRSQLRSIVYIFIALNFVFNFAIIIPLPYLLNTIWKVDAVVYGIIQGGLPAGMIIGALLVKRVMGSISYGRLLQRVNFTSCLLLPLFGLLPLLNSGKPGTVFILIYYTLLMLTGGIIVSWVDIPLSVLLQKIVPETILGRVISVKLSIVKTVVPIALFLSGYLVNHFHPVYLFFLGSLFFTFFNIWFFFSPRGQEFAGIEDSQLTA